MTTTNLGMTLPTIGGDTDTWGAELNADLTTLDAMLAGVLKGLELSAAGSTGTFGVAAGAASGMALASAYTKTTSSWAVGSGSGSMSSDAAVGNNKWYHVWLIQRSDTGVVDILTSEAVTAGLSPTLPSGYDRKRRIGSMKTDGSAQWVKFSQNGDEFLWGAVASDAVGVTPGATTASSLALTVPPGVKVNALIDLLLVYSSGSPIAYLSSLDQDDAAAGVPFTAAVTVSSQFSLVPKSIRTNTSGQMRARFNATTCTYYINTNGWMDRRGQ